MPEFVRLFQAGRMNKDLDERLVPNGEYRDALNLDLANSEGSNVGALQNLKGTLELRGKSGRSLEWEDNFIDSLQNASCIGSYVDPSTEKIYWFIASDGVSAIAEYDQTQNVVFPILVDTNNILKFSPSYLITGINIIEGILLFTDDQMEPKKINIEKFRTGSTDFATHSKIPDYNPLSETYNNNLAGRPDFAEEDITLIKKSPLTAPTLNLAASKFGADIPGTGVTPVSTLFTTSGLENFTYIPDTVEAAGDTESMPTHGVYEDNIETDPNYYSDSNLPSNYGQGINITVSSSIEGVWNEGDIILLSGSYSNEYNETFSYEIRLLVVSIINPVNIKVKILSISPEIQVFENPVIWDCILEEKEPLFEYVFPRFAYRWKYEDGEYSCYSTFSDVAFVGAEFAYLSSDGHNKGMSNNIRKLIVENLTWGSDEVIELDILYKEDSSPAVYVVDTLKKKNYSPYFGVDSLPTDFNIISEIIGNIVESNQLLRPWDNVPRKAKSQEVIGNRVVFANYLQNYPVTTVSLNAAALSQPHPDQSSDNDYNRAKKSIKSIRNYQTGVVFKDEYGRETPVVTDSSAGVDFSVFNSNDINKIELSPSGDAPDWATHYKFFIKDISNEYYNLALDRFYPAEDGNVWLSFPSSERNKVTEDTYLILKKQHATPESVEELLKYRILSISNEAPTFIKRRRKAIGRSDVTTISSARPQVGSVFFKFTGPSADADPNFAGGFSSNASLRISFGSNSTDVYEIQSGGPTGAGNQYGVSIDTPLGDEAFFLNSLPVGSSITIVLFEEEDKELPEFSGRFFAKINRDVGFEKNVVDTFPIQEDEYGIKNSFQVLPFKTQGNGDSSQQAVWYDKGNNSGSSSRRRPHGHQCPWKYPGECADKTKWTVMVHGLLREDRNNPASWLGGSMEDLSKVGTYIRFADAAGNIGQIYSIRATDRAFKRRGLRSSNSNYDNFSNGRNQWNITFNEPYEDFGLFSNRVGSNPIAQIQILEKVPKEENKTLSSTDPAIFETEPKEAIDLDIYYEASDALPISQFNQPYTLSYYNAFSFGNGVESNRIRDDFNAATIAKGVKASSIIDEPYAAERRGSGFIFSQIFNSTSGINRLNQFIQAEAITKDLNPVHGTIQKLHARDTDLITLCEDKCFRILANKDALFNADGNSQLTGNKAVLGQSVPYAGNYGISKNPESFASHAFRAYFSDKNRGAVIRLSRDGITVISEKGMEDFFADNTYTSTKIIGSYDEDKDLYNITLNKLSNDWEKILSQDKEYNLTVECDSQTEPNSVCEATTVSFKEKVDGWTSRKSFIPESGVSLNNEYYTFKNGLMHHHNGGSIRNNFYGIQYNSTVNVLFNEMPQVVKGFSALNYTGTVAREIEYLYNNVWYSIAEINASQIIPTASRIKREGWYTNYIRTNLEAGEVKEFENKEGKYFNYIKALHVCKLGDGIGEPDVVDPDPQNYILTVTIDPECSGSGGTVPDTTQFFINIWDNTKNDPIYDLNIESLTTAQEVKCAIEDHYNLVNQNYTGVLNDGTAFSYVLADGLQPGTQMYNNLTNEPITSAGAYLFVGVGQYLAALTVDHAGLDYNNSTPVPLTYYVMILNSSGVIASYTQYSTLTACQGDPDRSLRGTGALSSPMPGVSGYNFSIPFKTSQQVVCGIKQFMITYNSLDPQERNQGWSVPTLYWYGPGDFQVGTQLYSYTVAQGFFKKNHNSQGNPGAFGRKEVYRLGNAWNGQLMHPFGNYWTSSTTVDDEWFIITTNTLGVITAIEQYNTFDFNCTTP
jgi:hypothetical protein